MMHDDEDRPRTACVPAFGGLTLPSVIAFHISSAGTSGSDHGTVKSGESHRTIDDGSSYRNKRLSSLHRHSERAFMIIEGSHSRLRRIFPVVLSQVIPFSAHIWCRYDIHLLHFLRHAVF